MAASPFWRAQPEIATMQSWGISRTPHLTTGDPFQPDGYAHVMHIQVSTCLQYRYFFCLQGFFPASPLEFLFLPPILISNSVFFLLPPGFFLPHNCGFWIASERSVSCLQKCLSYCGLCLPPRNMFFLASGEKNKAASQVS